ncbi:Cu(I)/Ag(I) efflux system membrane protein CusA/SilA [Thermotomaculum hydrothermale]|uniref:Cu(I)/Ag(I) efflux system membrane protein CusA/SilA n=1 Tax=Thermotomaculum hydrothermale TaxID=981385 RepID=A0A7R6PP51_9BACT|nr:efflux RND transporter permease subunit [Thermotomaculum hydrothermale]BBB31796.1 Cu(I)/Ag(I) efflux system membrane protein CusA/SilA [Thermotomaculum hydrothermale]
MKNEKIEPKGFLEKLIYFSIKNKLVIGIFIAIILFVGAMVSPFDFDIAGIQRDPVPVDAIPDVGENQQIVFTKWPGRSPQDIEDQITYPLTVALLGIPEVKTIRSFSMFGFSTIYVIFKEKADFYWSRSRILEKLNSLPPNTLPEGVKPSLGPDATALGQVFWYTLEGRDNKGNPTGGWDLQELRSIQDWYVRYALLSADGVSEVASVGGYVKEYQIDVDPDALKAYGITLEQVFKAAKMSNLDVGAKSIEINNVEYVIRGIGFIKKIKDIEDTVITVRNNTPIYIKNVANVTIGPAMRRGILDKEGAEVVGGVVVARFGENPLKVIKNIKEKIKEISPGLPSKKLKDGTVSKVTVVPFYDRSGLIYETLGTLKSALTEEIFVTIIVVLLMVMHFRSSLLISGLLPLAVIMTFIAMKVFKVDANIVSLSGIAIAIGTLVDMGIVIVENIIKHLSDPDNNLSFFNKVFVATKEVGGAVLTAVSTTVIGFLPVFAMEGPEGKLFKPLAFTKTFALISAIIIALTIIPPVAHLILKAKVKRKSFQKVINASWIVLGIISFFLFSKFAGIALVFLGIYHLTKDKIAPKYTKYGLYVINGIAAIIVATFLAEHWLPLGAYKGFTLNFLFVVLIIGSILLFFQIFQFFYPSILRWALNNRKLFLLIPVFIILFGALSWLGFEKIFGWLPVSVKRLAPVSYFAHKFPGLGKEFMPPLDEGSYLYMPTTSTHASIGVVKEVLKIQDSNFKKIPEIETAVGKLGRAETPLDPAPISMIETVINYKPEYITDKNGNRLLFKFNPDEVDYYRDENGNPVLAPDGKPYRVQGRFERDKYGKLIPDKDGSPFKLWRPELDPELNPGREYWKGITSPDNIWKEIVEAGTIPGLTSAPKLQPIAARIVMLQSGMRAPMGLKIKGPDLKTIEKVGLEIEKFLKEVPYIDPNTVVADRMIGKPYLEINIDRQAIARYGIPLVKVQNAIETAIGGKTVTTTIEGRERYNVRVQYFRELRNDIDKIGNVLISSPTGAQIPLKQLSKINYVKGPQVIKSEDTFLTGYVIFDKRGDYAEVDVVEQAKRYLKEKIKTGELVIPAGVSYSFAGNYQNQIRAAKKLAIVLPLALFTIFLILYFQFKRVSTTLLVFSGILVAWAGGFILIWFYGQPWFMDFNFLGVNLRDLFQMHHINLSVAIWVGFLALFGIASDDGVIIATYLDQIFEVRKPETVEEIRKATIEAGKKRVRPALMTVATTVIALIPVLTSKGRGSDIMIPMSIPTFGGMIVVVITIFVVPVLYSLIKEISLKRSGKI